LSVENGDLSKLNPEDRYYSGRDDTIRPSLMPDNRVICRSVLESDDSDIMHSPNESTNFRHWYGNSRQSNSVDCSSDDRIGGISNSKGTAINQKAASRTAMRAMSSVCSSDHTSLNYKKDLFGNNNNTKPLVVNENLHSSSIGSGNNRDSVNYASEMWNFESFAASDDLDPEILREIDAISDVSDLSDFEESRRIEQDIHCSTRLSSNLGSNIEQAQHVEGSKWSQEKRCHGISNVTANSTTSRFVEKTQQPTSPFSSKLHLVSSNAIECSVTDEELSPDHKEYELVCIPGQKLKNGSTAGKDELIIGSQSVVSSLSGGIRDVALSSVPLSSAAAAAAEGISRDVTATRVDTKSDTDVDKLPMNLSNLESVLGKARVERLLKNLREIELVSDGSPSHISSSENRNSAAESRSSGLRQSSVDADRVPSCSLMILNDQATGTANKIETERVSQGQVPGIVCVSAANVMSDGPVKCSFKVEENYAQVRSSGNRVTLGKVTSSRTPSWLLLTDSFGDSETYGFDDSKVTSVEEKLSRTIKDEAVSTEVGSGVETGVVLDDSPAQVYKNGDTSMAPSRLFNAGRCSSESRSILSISSDLNVPHIPSVTAPISTLTKQHSVSGFLSAR